MSFRALRCSVKSLILDMEPVHLPSDNRSFLKLVTLPWSRHGSLAWSSFSLSQVFKKIFRRHITEANLHFISFGRDKSAHFSCLLHPRPSPSSWFPDWDWETVETSTNKKWWKGRRRNDSLNYSTDLWSGLRALRGPSGRQEDGSKMARGGLEGAVAGLEGDTSFLLPRRANAHGREDGAFLHFSIDWISKV